MIFLVDSTGLYYRSYYALKKSYLKTSTGFPTFAIFGFLRSLIKYKKDYKAKDFIFVFDSPLSLSNNIRKNNFSQYKAKRKKIYQNDFKIQLPVLKNILKLLGFPVVESGIYEADDILASLANKYKEDKNTKVGIITFDKDLFQVIKENISIYRIKQKLDTLEIWDKNKFLKEFNFEPIFFPDYLALCGDPVDNIPGIPGIGPKIAKNLVISFGNLENIYDNLQKMEPSIRRKLEDFKTKAFEYRNLVKLKTDLDIDLERQEADIEKLKEILLSKLEMKKLTSEIEKAFFG